MILIGRVEILDVERNYNKRIVSEIVNIKCQKNGINLQTDTDALDRAYFSILQCN